MKMINRLLIIGMVALILVSVFAVAFSHNVYAYEGAGIGEKNNSGDKWGGDFHGNGGGPGAIQDPGFAGQPGGKP